MEMNGNNRQVFMQIQTYYRSSCSHVKKYLFWKIPWKVTVVESYFRTVTGLAILSNQEPTTGVFVKTFQAFQNTYFLSNTSKQLLLNLYIILIVSATSFLPYLYAGTRRRGGLTSSGFYVGSPPGQQCIEIQKHINAIQYNSDRCLPMITI